MQARQDDNDSVWVCRLGAAVNVLLQILMEQQQQKSLTSFFKDVNENRLVPLKCVHIVGKRPHQIDERKCSRAHVCTHTCFHKDASSLSHTQAFKARKHMHDTSMHMCSLTLTALYVFLCVCACVCFVCAHAHACPP
jgi:hypothetical protein